MHIVAVLLLPSFVSFDMAIPGEMFSRVQVADVDSPYLVTLCAETRRIKGDFFCAEIEHGLDFLERANTIIVPGVTNLRAPASPKILSALRDAATRGARIASICSGTFVLAAAGLLEGRRATTHWLAAAELAQRYPTIEVDPAALFIDEGNILTSAGAAAGIDLCLYLIRRDYGSAAAANAARLAVVPLARDGGQAQFIRHDTPTLASSLQPVLEWIWRHLKTQLTLNSIARQAHTSTRTLTRRFVTETGTSPLQWLLGARVRRAQELLETTALSIDQVAQESGFGSATSLREHFRRITGTTPVQYRKSFARTLPGD